MQPRLSQKKRSAHMLEPKFLIDANMPRSSAEVMRSFGYDVEDVRKIGMKAAKDQEIIQYAFKTKRIIATRDTDFGEVLRYPSHPGAIIFRLPYSYTSYEINKIIEDFLKSIKLADLSNAIIIVELGRYRRRPL
jgi:predicted nuclease of predicted toxin-antitoxin system